MLGLMRSTSERNKAPVAPNIGVFGGSLIGGEPMSPNTTRWRVSPVAWLPIALALAAESISNALRAYGLGMHLEKFTVSYQGYTVSLAGSVLVLAAIAVSLSQARAAWVALTPDRPLRQRLVAGAAAILLLAVSITAMASHILDAQRAKVADEGGSRGTYDRAKAAYDRAKAEYDALGNPRAVSVIQAEVRSSVTDWNAWRRSAECSDITREDSAKACQPILALYKERGKAARKAELEPELAQLRTALAGMHRPEEHSVSEATAAAYWSWLMGFAVVFVATFGTVIFATATTVPLPAAMPAPAKVPVIEDEPVASPSGGSKGPVTKEAALADLKMLLRVGQSVPSQDWLKDRWGLGSKATPSKWLSEWEEAGEIPSRMRVGKCNTLEAA